MLCEECQRDGGPTVSHKGKQLCKTCFSIAYEQARQAKAKRTENDVDPQLGS